MALESSQTPQSPATPDGLTEAKISDAICNGARRRILMEMLAHGPQCAANLRTVCGQSRDLIRKNIAFLRELGFIVPAGGDEADGRRVLYDLTPEVRAMGNSEKLELDFGFCVLRMPPKATPPSQ